MKTPFCTTHASSEGKKVNRCVRKYFGGSTNECSIGGSLLKFSPFLGDFGVLVSMFIFLPPEMERRKET